MRFITDFFRSNYLALETAEIPTRFSEYWASALHFWGKAWWIEISTSQPSCLYYFGPFANSQEAERLMAGYVEDLESESAQGIKTKIIRCKPDKLTIGSDSGLPEQELAYTLKTVS
jgi:Domain of unknown function (DUF1816)